MGSRFVSNFDLGSIPKTEARRLAQAVTKSNVSTSSLSKTRIGFTSPVGDAWRLFNRLLSRSKLESGQQYSTRCERHRKETAPVSENNEIFGQRPLPLVRLGDCRVDGGRLLFQRRQIQRLRGLAGLPHVFHAPEAVDVFFEDLIENLPSKFRGTDGLTNFLQSQCFLAKGFNLFLWETLATTTPDSGKSAGTDYSRHLPNDPTPPSPPRWSRKAPWKD